MFKKIIILVLLLFFFTINNYGQENKIRISPNNLTATSSILIEVKEIGDYSIQLSDNLGEIIFIKNFKVLDKKLFAFKYNFKNLKKGNYTFEVIKKKKIITRLNLNKK
tara:strand:- start:54 stop:377 length:324 start_codon:yes stop_codon:yes gene_type:complete